MKKSILSTAATFAIVLWAGITWAAGYVFAPMLFSVYSREQAGEVAGHLFAAVNITALVCGMIVLLDYRVRFAKVLAQQRGLWLVLLLLFAVLMQYLGLTPMMQKAKSIGDMVQFGRLHGASQVVYLLQSIGLAALVYLQFKSGSGGVKPK